MSTIHAIAEKFLTLERIAVAGVSRTESNAANLIYRTLRANGGKVFAVNPNAKMVEGDVCYPNLGAIPDKPDGVIIVVKPEVTDEIVRECASIGIGYVWMHNGISSSVSETAVEFCRENGISVIPGGCPMMFLKNADLGHRFFRWWQTLTGKLPKEISTLPASR